jgi:hypothetical protein
MLGSSPFITSSGGDSAGMSKTGRVIGFFFFFGNKLVPLFGIHAQKFALRFR